MKTFSKATYLFLSIIFLAACSTTRKVALNPVSVTANKAGAYIYHGSYPKLSDILHTRLDLKFDWDSTFVIGKAWIDARPWFYPSNTLILDAKGFKIGQVALALKDELIPLKYVYDRRKLTITLNRTYTHDQKYTVYIEYVAMPNNLRVGPDIGSSGERGFYFVNADGKDKDQPQQFWTQGETENNSCWFPTIDGPQEKMTQEISLTVPNRMVTLSNGVLDFSSDNGDGTRTDTWRQEQPHSTYLTMVAGGDFKVVKDKWRDKEVNYYVEPPFAANARQVFGKTPEMIGFFSKLTGIDYPWEKYAQIAVRNFYSGAMENTTATVLFERMNMTADQYLDETYESIISHELFHHWFGDYVTAESWANLPLNESFATYGEYLWNEHKYGLDIADQGGWHDLQEYLSSEKGRQEKLIRYDYADKEQMFDVVSYQKGARVLHMLRKTVGDDAFFKSLHLYLTKNAFKNAEINDLRMAFEEVTGQDLNWFFNQWFLSPGHPVLKITTRYDSLARKLSVTIGQVQDLNSVPLYRLPLAIDIYQGGRSERKDIVLERQTQTFSFEVPASPDLVNVDAEKYLVGEKIEEKSLQQYIYQYDHAPLFTDRAEAMEAFAKMIQDKAAQRELRKALDDKNWELRRDALEQVVKFSEDEKAAAYVKVREMAVSDVRSYVRAAAIAVLKKAYSGRDNHDVWEKLKNDKAPSVRKALGDKS